MNLFNLFEGPTVDDDGNLESLLKKAEIQARGYIDRADYTKIAKSLQGLAKAIANYREMRSEATWGTVKAALGNLLQYGVSNSDVLAIAGPAALDSYKTLVNRMQNDAEKRQERQAQQFSQNQAAAVAQQQAEIDAATKLPDGVEVYNDSLPLSKGTLAVLGEKHFMQNVKQGFYDDVSVLGNMVFKVIADNDWLSIFPRSFNTLSEVHETSFDIAQNWIDHLKRNGTYEHLKVHGTELYIPKPEIISALATSTLATVFNKNPEVAKQMDQKFVKAVQKESINESVNTHDKLIATVANYMYVKHPEIFTQHGDGYVMTVVDDVVSKWEQQDEPMQDIKAYALEVMDALGVDRTNEAIATIKTDYKGHHLMNADGEEVQSYPKNVEGLKKARNTLYINNKGLNTMKQEGLNEAFEAALEKLSLNESVTINTTTTSEGDDTVTVTATNEDAYELVALLKAAGLPHKADEVEAQIVAAPCGEQVEEEFANEPTDDVMNGDMDDMNTQSGGLNRRKMQFKHSYRQGDNPMAMNEENLLRGLWDLYKEAK